MPRPIILISNNDISPELIEKIKKDPMHFLKENTKFFENINQLKNNDIEIVLKIIDKETNLKNPLFYYGKILQLCAKIYFLLNLLHQAFKKHSKLENFYIDFNRDTGYGLCLNQCRQLCETVNAALSDLGWPITFKLQVYDLDSKMHTDNNIEKFIKYYIHLCQCLNYFETQIKIKTIQEEIILKKMSQVKYLHIQEKKDHGLRTKKHNEIIEKSNRSITKYIKGEENSLGDIKHSVTELKKLSIEYEKTNHPNHIKFKTDAKYHLGVCSFYYAHHLIHEKTTDKIIENLLEQVIMNFNELELDYEKNTSEINEYTLYIFNQGAGYELKGDYYSDLADRENTSEREKKELIEKSKDAYKKAKSKYEILSSKTTEFDEQQQKDILSYVFGHRLMQIISYINPHELTPSNFIDHALESVEKSLEFCQEKIEGLASIEIASENDILYNDDGSNNNESESDNLNFTIEIDIKPNEENAMRAKRVSKNTTHTNHDRYTLKTEVEKFVRNIKNNNKTTWENLEKAFQIVIDRESDVATIDIYKMTLLEYLKMNHITARPKFEKRETDKLFGTPLYNDPIANMIRDKYNTYNQHHSLNQEETEPSFQINRQDRKNLKIILDETSRPLLKKWYHEFLDQKFKKTGEIIQTEKKSTKDSENGFEIIIPEEKTSNNEHSNPLEEYLKTIKNKIDDIETILENPNATSSDFATILNKIKWPLYFVISSVDRETTEEKTNFCFPGCNFAFFSYSPRTTTPNSIYIYQFNKTHEGKVFIYENINGEVTLRENKTNYDSFPKIKRDPANKSSDTMDSLIKIEAMNFEKIHYVELFNAIKTRLIHQINFIIKDSSELGINLSFLSQEDKQKFKLEHININDVQKKNHKKRKSPKSSKEDIQCYKKEKISALKFKYCGS